MDLPWYQHVNRGILVLPSPRTGMIGEPAAERSQAERPASQQACACTPGRELIKLLGRSHVHEILYWLTTRVNPGRFNEIKRELNLTATILSRRLNELVDHGLVIRSVYAEVPARVEYELSDMGKELGPIMQSLFNWAEKART